MSRERSAAQTHVGTETRLSPASAARFSLYLRCLEEFQNQQLRKISSSQLGEALRVTDAQVRKDLASIGSLGQPGIGYLTSDLITAIRQALGIDRHWKTVLVGIGNLGRALLGYQGFQKRGFKIVALFDNNPTQIGKEFQSLIIHPISAIHSVITESGAEIGVIAVPSEAAQSVADQLVDAGIKGLLNFAPTMLRIPKNVGLKTVDLTVQLEQLAFLIQGIELS